MARRRALIIGGSVGGLFAAHLLRSIGWEVLVFERNADDLSSRGAGIGTQDALLATMDRLGMPVDATMAVEVLSCVCLDRGGRIVQEMKLRRMMSAWARFYRPLRDALPEAFYRPGYRLERVEPERDGVTAVFADGTRETGDLLVGADGIRSTVRAQFLPDVRPEYAGYIGWRAMVNERDVPASFRDTLFDLYTFCLPDRGLVVAYPVPALDGDTRRGHRGYNVVWYWPTDEAALAEISTDATGRRHDAGIPPPLIRPEVVAEMKANARATLAPQIAEILELAEQPFFQPIYDFASPRLVFGRTALLGDAAFVARPHGGAGVTKAALDACGLVELDHGRQRRRRRGARPLRPGTTPVRRLDRDARPRARGLCRPASGPPAGTAAARVQRDERRSAQADRGSSAQHLTRDPCRRALLPRGPGAILNP